MAVLVIATRNRKKGQEMGELLAPAWEPGGPLHELRIVTLDVYPALPEVVEDAETFAGNARKKAVETAQALGMWTVADDSGLAVDVLEGAPGVYSARYAGAHGDDASNNRKLLAELAGVEPERRGAAFVCALALSDPTGVVRFEAQAHCRGRILDEERGGHGFGYDPLFLIREYHRTFGELGPLVKHQISHRSRAFAQLRPALVRLMEEGGEGWAG
jgi:XTP/dITP diphosphohydrolase